MTEETVDRIIRCMKECWWRVGILLALIFGFVLLVTYGWPQGDWALDWTALAAIGGLAAGFGAFYAARVALRIAEEEAKAREKNKRKQAAIYKWIMMIELVQLRMNLNSIEGLLAGYEEIEEGSALDRVKADLLLQAKDRLRTPFTLEKIHEAYIFGENTSQHLAAIVANFPTLSPVIELIASPPALVTPEKKILVKFVLDTVAALNLDFRGVGWFSEPNATFAAFCLRPPQTDQI